MLDLEKYSLDKLTYESDNTLIYAGHQKGTGFPVIAKVLRRATTDRQAFLNFEKEFHLIRSLDHPGIIRYLDFVDIPRGKAIIMEDSGSLVLPEYLRSGRRELRTLLDISHQMAGILNYIHTLGLVLRDLKPANIIISPEDRRIRFIDFGLATRIRREIQEASQTDTLVGTLAYISPEQTGRVNRSMDTRSDLYSLGISLYEIFTGELPFRYGDPLEMIHAHIALKPTPPKTRFPRMPQVLSDIILKLLEKEPQLRYQSAGGVAEDLAVCLETLNAQDEIPKFQPGLKDFSPDFHLPEELYGRKKELAVLEGELKKAESGENRMVILTGPPGIGKSRLMAEIRKPLAAAGGRLVSGKFESQGRDIPYSGYIRCLEALAGQLLAEREDRLEEIRARILGRLEGNGKIITDLVPLYQTILGPQPELPHLGPAENQARFYQTLIGFFRALARKNAPLVVFLDDMHWADPASLSLTHHLLHDGDLKYILLVTSYRPEELDEFHPLTLFFSRLSHTGINWWTELPLSALDLRAVAEMVADTLVRRQEEVEELAGIIGAKTGANPFFVREFLVCLKDSGAIWFEGKWSWDLEKILQARSDDTVADLLASRLSSISETEFELLGILAALGQTADLAFLSAFTSRSIDDLLGGLEAAINTGLILKSGRALRFSHDRIAEAVLQHLPPDQKASVHLNIGRFYLGELPPQERDSRIFEVVHQLNAGFAAMDSTELRFQTGELNMAAGRRSLRSGAYQAAADFFTKASEIHGSGLWEKDYNRMVEFSSDFCEALYLSGRLEEAESLFRTILERTTSVMDRVRAYETMLTCYTSVYRLEDALKIGRDALAQFGIRIPKKSGKGGIALRLVKVLLALKGRKAQDVSSLPPVLDPRKQAVMRLLMACTEPAYLSNNGMQPVFVLTMAKYSLRWGNSPWSGFAWAAFGVIQSAVLGRPAEGLNYAREALKLVSGPEAGGLRCRVNFLLGDMLQHWTGPLKESLPYLMETYKAGVASGDYLWASYGLNNYLFYTFFKGDDLASVKEKAERHHLTMKKFNQPHALECYELWYQLILSLTGESGKFQVDGPLFPEKDTVARWKTGNARSALGYYGVAKLISGYHSGEYLAAMAQSRETEPYMEALMGMFFQVEFQFYTGLNYLYGVLTGQCGPSNLRVVRRCVAALEKLGHYSPDVGHKSAILRGGLALSGGNMTTAARWLDKGTTGARVRGYTQDAAIAQELAAQGYLQMGLQTLAGPWLAESCEDYLRWGLDAKVLKIRSDWGHLMPAPVRSSAAGLQSEMTLNSITTRTAGETRDLDLSTVIKASNILSSTIHLEDLLEKLIRVVMENAGAQRGVLILKGEEGYTVEAEGLSSESLEISLKHVPLRDTSDLPASAISFVARSKNRLILNRQERDEVFENDPYIQRVNPGSILVQPLVHQGALVGILYLEHRQSAQTFTLKHLQLLNMLSTQIAISVSNALLYREQKRLTDSYCRFVPREFIDYLGKRSILDVELGDQIQGEMSILFSDIRGFTTLSEGMSPSENFNFLNDYLARVSPVVRAHGGFIDKYIGDAIMALFPANPADAVNAALGIQREVREWNLSQAHAGSPKLEVGIGIHSGSLMLGTIGEAQRMDTTVISDAVNVASRLESLTKTYGVPIIVSEPVMAEIGPGSGLTFRFLDVVRPVGKSRPITLWELLEGWDEVTRDKKAAGMQDFERAVELYRKHEFAAAAELFNAIHESNPADIPAKIYRDRCLYWSTHPISPDWDGIQILKSK